VTSSRSVVSSTNKTNLEDIAEILLIVALNTITIKKGQTTIYKTLYRKLKIEQLESH